MSHQTVSHTPGVIPMEGAAIIMMMKRIAFVQSALPILTKHRCLEKTINWTDSDSEIVYLTFVQLLRTKYAKKTCQETPIKTLQSYVTSMGSTKVKT